MKILSLIHSLLLAASFNSVSAWAAASPTSLDVPESEKYALFSKVYLAGGRVGGKCPIADVDYDTDPDGTRTMAFSLTDPSGEITLFEVGITYPPWGKVTVTRGVDAAGNTVVKTRNYLVDPSAHCTLFGCGFKLYDMRVTFVISPGEDLVGYRQWTRKIVPTLEGAPVEITHLIDCAP